MGKTEKQSPAGDILEKVLRWKQSANVEAAEIKQMKTKRCAWPQHEGGSGSLYFQCVLRVEDTPGQAGLTRKWGG